MSGRVLSLSMTLTLPADDHNLIRRDIVIVMINLYSGADFDRPVRVNRRHLATKELTFFADAGMRIRTYVRPICLHRSALIGIRASRRRLWPPAIRWLLDAR